MELLEDSIRLLADDVYVVLVVVYLGGYVMDIVSVACDSGPQIRYIKLSVGFEVRQCLDVFLY